MKFFAGVVVGVASIMAFTYVLNEQTHRHELQRRLAR